MQRLVEAERAETALSNTSMARMNNGGTATESEILLFRNQLKVTTNGLFQVRQGVSIFFSKKEIEATRLHQGCDPLFNSTCESLSGYCYFLRILLPNIYSHEIRNPNRLMFFQSSADATKKNNANTFNKNFYT